jgi:predicted nucleotidyltransferase
MKNNNPDIKLLQSIFGKYKDIQAVYLFGSYASGKIHHESDIDLAIVPSNSNVRRKKLSILTDLASHGFCNVDLVFLDVNDIIVKFEAVRQNRIIYKTTNFNHGAYFSKVLRQYFDFVPYLNVQRQAYKERILNGKI